MSKYHVDTACILLNLLYNVYAYYKYFRKLIIITLPQT